jgi:hypothetical protein
MDERYKLSPINFYRDPEGVRYINPFISGRAKDLTTALNDVLREFDDLKQDILIYQDVVDVNLKAYSPVVRKRKTKGMELLGTLPLELDLVDTYDYDRHFSKNTVNYALKNKDTAEHDKLSDSLRKQSKSSIIDNIKRAFRR